MQSEVSVKGMVTWESIGIRFAFNKCHDKVSDCMTKHAERSADNSLFAVIPDISKHQYVLIRNRENRISGIVTATDLGQQFGERAEPFLILGEIEQHVRLLLKGKFTKQELSDAKDPGDTAREVVDVEDLTFGEYIRLLENPDRWQKLCLPIDRKGFLSQLQEVRQIRNDVMHFDPDGISEEELNILRKVARLLEKMQEVAAS